MTEDMLKSCMKVSLIVSLVFLGLAVFALCMAAYHAFQ